MKEIRFHSKLGPRWLSNFHMNPIVGKSGKVWPSAEHAYQAAKTLDQLAQERVRQASTAVEAKRMGKTLTIREDWESDKLRVMRAILEAKFQGDLAQQLIDTGDDKLIHYCPWGDRVWGVDKRGEGANHLGQMLMEIREQLTT
jgi:N-glycosidase YbiA